MGFQCGTLDAKTGTTGTQVYSVLSEQPVAMIFWGGECTALDTDTTPVVIFHGVTDGTNDAVMNAGVNGNAASGDYDTTACCKVKDSGGITRASATLSSWNSSSFTLNWTTVHSTNAYKIHWIALSGSELTNAYVDAFTFGTGSSKASTAPGFTPDWIFVIARKATRNGYSVGCSNGTGSGNENAMGFRWRSSNVNRYSAYDTVDQCAVMADDSATPEQYFSLTSFDASGYTIGRDSGDANDADFIVLSIKGGSFSPFTFTSPTTATTKSVSGLGFQPEGVFFMALDDASGASGSTINIPIQWGAMNSTTELAYWVDWNGTTDEDHGITQSKVIRLKDDTGTTVEEADYSSLDSGGFTVSYSTADSAANAVMGWAFRGEPAAGGGLGIPIAAYHHNHNVGSKL